MNKKLLIIIGIILGLALLVAGSFWYVQRYVQDDSQEVANSEQENIEVIKNESNQNKINQNQEIENKEIANQEKKEIKPPNTEDWRTAKWITYKDKKNGFEVKYPDSFTKVDASNYHNYQDGDFIIKHIDTQRYIRELNYGAAQIGNQVYVSVRENKDNLSLIEWLQKNDARCSNCVKKNPIDCKFGCDFYGMKIIKINGKKALTLHEPSITDNEAIYFNLGNKIVEFHGQDVTLDSNNGDNFFRKMMESFKIIN